VNGCLASGTLPRFGLSRFAVLFLVETGAYINAIRMDILATALAHRHGMPKPGDVYFPVANLRLMGSLLSVR
jgi:hypothetical protein